MPLFVFRSIDAWTGDGPVFVLYADGRVLFHRDGEWKTPYFLVRLDAAERKRLLRELSLPQMSSLRDEYDISDATRRRLKPYCRVKHACGRGPRAS